MRQLRADIDAATAGDKSAADDKREGYLSARLQRGDPVRLWTGLESVKRGERERGRAMCVRMFGAGRDAPGDGEWEEEAQQPVVPVGSSEACNENASIRRV